MANGWTTVLEETDENGGLLEMGHLKEKRRFSILSRFPHIFVFPRHLGPFYIDKHDLYEHLLLLNYEGRILRLLEDKFERHIFYYMFARY